MLPEKFEAPDSSTRGIQVFECIVDLLEWSLSTD